MQNLNNFTKQINDLIFYLDGINGNRLFRSLKKEELAAIEQDEEKMGAYLALRFLIIPFLSTKEIAGLLNENLSAGLQIDDLELTERITKKLIEIDLGDRDNCKKELKTALINSKEELIGPVTVWPNKKIRTVSDWIKDYVGQMSEGKRGALGEAQYFYQKTYFVKLKENEKNLLKKLFSLYRFLSISSLTPEGFEDDLLIEDELGRLITTNKGKIVVLYDPKRMENKIIEKAPPMVVSKGLSEEEKQIIDLKKMVAKYPAGSFERKAIEEEIKKLGL